jgi:uncharacterized protein YjiK
MPPLTRPLRGETTRKPRRVWLAALAAVALGGGGCATRGPNHVYATTADRAAVQDLGPAGTPIRDALKPGEQAVGLAYDFNTDHLFVRVVPAQLIRVIERPSGKILREMPLALPDNLPKDKVVGTNTRPAEAGNGAPSADLAIRSSDRHLFAVHPDGRSVVELTLYGEFVRRVEVQGIAGRIVGLAYDQRGNRLLALFAAAGRAQVGALAPEGNVTHCITLGAAVAPVSLGYDSDARRYFVPLADGHALAEFDATGQLVATHPADGVITAIDAGPRSFLRVF